MFSSLKTANIYIKVMLPGARSLMEIPAEYRIDHEDDGGILVFFPPKCGDKIVFRVSCFEPAVEREQPDSEQMVREVAAECGVEVTKQGNKVFCHCESEAEEGGTKFQFHRWIVGLPGRLVNFSATVLKQTTAVQKALKEVPRMIATLQAHKE